MQILIILKRLLEVLPFELVHRILEIQLTQTAKMPNFEEQQFYRQMSIKKQRNEMSNAGC